MAKHLSTADTLEGAHQLARMLAQAADAGYPGFGTHRADAVHELRVVADQARRLAAGQQPNLAHLRYLARPVRRRTEPALASAQASRVHVTHSYLAVTHVPVKDLVNRWAAKSCDVGRVGRYLLRLAVSLLPVPVQARYAEEYGAELWELGGLRRATRWQRVRHAMRLTGRAWLLRRALREAETALWAEWSRDG